MNLFLHSILLLIIATLVCTDKSSCAQEKQVDVIAFGSCAREREDQPIWFEILKKKPELFLMIGDNHYADIWSEDGGAPSMHPVTDLARFDEAYKALAAKPGFQKLRTECLLMATWDDHDYGMNDGGNEFPLREASQKKFLDFFGFASDDPIREQNGIYNSRIFGNEGTRLQVIMLDTRYHRDPLQFNNERSEGKGPYVFSKDQSKTILGAKQWEWLEKQLSKPADVRIIASSIQVVADEHGWETWGNIPHERERLYQLIKETKANGVVFVSGDRHLMEISCDRTRNVPYPMWDFTSSGLTQRASEVSEPNMHRIGPVRRTTNFGVISIDWGNSSSTTKINLEGYGKQGQLITRQSVFLSSLKVGGTQ